MRFLLDQSAEARIAEKIDALERLFVTHRTELHRFLVLTPQGLRVR